MTDILIRRSGHAGRVTLNRPDALNAMTWEMCRAIADAMRSWRDDPLLADASRDALVGAADAPPSLAGGPAAAAADGRRAAGGAWKESE